MYIVVHAIKIAAEHATTILPLFIGLHAAAT